MRGDQKISGDVFGAFVRVNARPKHAMKKLFGGKI
jgi:hypothetical protein